MPTPWLRIISDVHFGHPASRVTALRSLRPLLAEAPVVWNGDSVEAMREHRDPGDRARADDLRAFVRAQPAPALVLTGNHDPLVSPHHDLELGGGALWITHGDVIYDAIAPWGRNASHLLALMEPHLSRGSLALPERFRAMREACAALECEHRASGVWTGLAERLREVLFPPARAWRMVRAWHGAPALACALAAAHRPQAKLILIGHTHLPGAWRTDRGTWVVNTGSFSPPLGPRIVELVPGAVRVRALDCRAGEWRPGRVLREIALDIPPGPLPV